MRNTDAIVELVSMAIAAHNAERLENGTFAGVLIPAEHRDIILDYVREDSSALDDSGDLQGIINSVRDFVERMARAEIDSIDAQWFYDSESLTDEQREDKTSDFISDCLYFDFDNGYYIKEA